MGNGMLGTMSLWGCKVPAPDVVNTRFAYPQRPTRLGRPNAAVAAKFLGRHQRMTPYWITNEMARPTQAASAESAQAQQHVGAAHAAHKSMHAVT